MNTDRGTIRGDPRHRGGSKEVTVPLESGARNHGQERAISHQVLISTPPTILTFPSGRGV